MNKSVIAVTIFNVDDEILIQSVCLGDITTDFKWKSGKKLFCLKYLGLFQFGFWKTEKYLNLLLHLRKLVEENNMKT